MASSPTEILTQRFVAPDGVELAWHELGEGRPVVLLHGYLSNAAVNWVRYGHAAAIAERGYRVIMPDLRGHGDSGKPHDPAAYPPDVLASDAEALIARLSLVDYDLGGYSLGARTTARLLMRGSRPRRAILAGMGLSGLTATGGRGSHFRHVFDNLGSFEKFSPEWNVEAFLKTTKGDVVALRLVLTSFVDTPEADLRALVTPTLVVAGHEDHDNGSAAALADVLPNATLVETEGGHMSAVTKPGLGLAIAEFLASA